LYNQPFYQILINGSSPSVSISVLNEKAEHLLNPQPTIEKVNVRFIDNKAKIYGWDKSINDWAKEPLYNQPFYQILLQGSVVGDVGDVVTGENDPQGFRKIYADGGQKRYVTKMKQSGDQGASDGIRFNIDDLPDDLINYECTYEVKCRDIKSGDKIRGVIKIGSHGKSDEKSALYGLRFGYDGTDKQQTVEFEGPHGTNVSCSGWTRKSTAKAIKAGDIFRVKATRRTNSKQVECRLFQDKNLDNNWTELTYFLDGPEPKCGGKRVQTGKIVHEGDAHVQATLRLNSMVADCIKCNLREIEGLPETQYLLSFFFFT